MISISIRDFQSINNASLEFEPGITVITGSTNSGKTAIFRALQYLLQNPGYAKHDIRHEQKKAEVELSIDGNPSIKWIRTATQVNYVVDNGKPNEKCGKADVWSFIPNYPIQLEPNGQILNFHTEFDTLFPFGNSPQELFKVFERVMALDDTASVLKAMNDDLSRVTMLRRHLNVSILEKQQVVEVTTSTLDALATELGSGEKASDSEVHLMLALNERMNHAYREVVQFVELNNLLDSSLPLLSFLDLSQYTLRELIDPNYSSECVLGDKEMKEEKGISEVFEKDIYFTKSTATSDPVPELGLSEVPQLADLVKEPVSKAEASFRTTVALYKSWIAYEDCSKQIQVLSCIPEVPEISLSTLESTRSLLSAWEQYSMAQRTLTALEVIPEPPVSISMSSYEALFLLIKNFDEMWVLLNMENNKQEELKSLEEKLRIINKEIAKFTTCELCGAPIVDGHFHSESD